MTEAISLSGQLEAHIPAVHVEKFKRGWLTRRQYVKLRVGSWSEWFRVCDTLKLSGTIKIYPRQTTEGKQ